MRINNLLGGPSLVARGHGHAAHAGGAGAKARGRNAVAEKFHLGPHHPDAAILGQHRKLFAYAHDREGEHFPAWAAFNRKLKDNRAVGIWHESYAITPEKARISIEHAGFRPGRRDRA